MQLIEVSACPDRERLISALVSDRALRTDQGEGEIEAGFEMRTAHRDLRAIRTEQIFLLNIEVRVGVGSVKINCDEIDLNPNVSEAIARAEGRWTITLPVFGDLVKAGTQLQTRRRKIQDQYLRWARPYWYVSRVDMPALRDEIFVSVDTDKNQQKSLMQLADELRARALEQYDEAFQKFSGDLYDILSRAGFEGDRLEDLAWRYAEAFPSRDKISQSFGVSLEGPIRIPSLVEEAERNADLATQLAREQAALNSLSEEQLQAEQQLARRAARLKEEQAIAQLQQYWIQEVQKSFAAGIRQAQDDAYGLLAEMLSTIQRVDDSGRLNNSLKKKLDSKLQQLQTAVNQISAVNEGEFDPTLQAFTERVRQLKVLTTSSVSPDALQQRIDAIRQSMIEEMDEIFSSQRKGHRALAKWLICEEE